MAKSKYTLDEKRNFARDMRHAPTMAEAFLWRRLEKRQLGYRFQRQAVVRGYIVDFYCAAARLAIEVDGSVHELEGRAAADEQKERILENYGIGMLRFSNEDVLNRVSVALVRIQSECAARVALKAFSPGTLVFERTPKVSSSNRPCAIHGKHESEQQRRPPQNKKPVGVIICQPWKLVQIRPAVQPADLAALNRKFATLIRQRSFNFAVYEDTRTMAERAFEQKYKLEQYLAQKRRPADETERRKLLRSAEPEEKPA